MHPERDFTAWLERRDAEALARVFDAVGGKLLLLAAHLAAPGQEASDLVQATFVAAMARGAGWDRQRPLWPWLAAVLHNEARMQLRRQRRRREVALESPDRAAAAVDDPGRVAASVETHDAVLATIEALPLPYRQVLRLRLVHGLQPIEIAQSLEVPVGTVRARLHRGLTQLRGALPSGIGAAVAVLFAGDGELLAQVRVRVLECAGAGAPVAAATATRAIVTGGAPINGKTLAIAGAGLLLILCGALAMPLVFAKDPAPREVAPVATAPVAPPTATLTAAPDQAPAARDAAAPAPPSLWSLTVHVEDEAARPLAGAVVTVWTAPAGMVFWNRESGVFLREDLAIGTTDANGDWQDGLAELWPRPALWRHTTRLWVEARTATAARKTDVLDLPSDPTAEPRTVTLCLRNTCGITGRLVAGDGTPIPHATVGAILAGATRFNDSARSDTEGRFLLACNDEPDAWPQRLGASAVAHGSATVAVPARTGDVIDVGDVALQPTGHVRGRLVLGDGSPIGGYQVQLQQIDPGLGTDVRAIRQWLMKQERRSEELEVRQGRVVCRAAQTNTRSDGTFAFATLDPAATFLLDLFAVHPVAAVVHAGDPDVELRVDQQLLTIECVDDDGLPLPGAPIHLDGFDPANTRPAWQPRPGFPAVGQICGNLLPCGDDEGHRIVLSPFGFVWRLYCTDDGLAPVAVRHEALPGVYHATSRINLRPDAHHGRLHVVAVDENGAAVKFGLALTALERDLYHNDKGSVLPPEGFTWDLPAGRWRVEAVLGKELIFMQGDGGFARGEQQHEVVIAPDRTTELRLVAPTAGLVAFEPFGAMPGGEGWRSLRIEEAGVDIGFLPYDPSDPRPATRFASPKQFVTKRGLSPGSHTFFLSADGCQQSPCTVTVVADAITIARVEMFAR
ncbi:MAG: sigma-70 family RNA polymerase sigma factor [Planctomycetota bacterium]